MKTDNELIADFMGFQYGQNSDHNGLLKYNTSWNWLMPVVLKIENELSKPGASKKVDWVLWNDHFDGTVITDIEMVYKAVIGFIKWYNEKL